MLGIWSKLRYSVELKGLLRYFLVTLYSELVVVVCVKFTKPKVCTVGIYSTQCTKCTVGIYSTQCTKCTVGIYSAYESRYLYSVGEYKNSYYQRRCNLHLQCMKSKTLNWFGNFHISRNTYVKTPSVETCKFSKHLNFI